jgi:hypothetical protein
MSFPVHLDQMQNFILLGLVVLATTETLKLVALVEELVRGLEVHGEVALAAELLAADAALVRTGLLVVRGAHVEEEVMLRGKFHAAGLALKLPVFAPEERKTL